MKKQTINIGAQLSRKDMKRLNGGAPPPGYTKWNCTSGSQSFIICHAYDPVTDGCGWNTCVNTGLRCNVLTCA